jgi:bifunctional non-homologous end joining protein LigD
MPLGLCREPFSDPEWLYEIKWDGFRALVHIERGRCRLISRNGNEFKSFLVLNADLPAELRARSAVLDGEIVALDRRGRTQFKDLFFRHGEPRFYAFDLLWCDGKDLRQIPLIERKVRLRSVVLHGGNWLLYCDHIDGDGEGLFRLACEHDLEGLVGKRKNGLYVPEAQTTWFKIRNRNYSQWVGREKLFERERQRNPDFAGRDSCVRACAGTS